MHKVPTPSPLVIIPAIMPAIVKRAMLRKLVAIVSSSKDGRGVIFQQAKAALEELGLQSFTRAAGVGRGFPRLAQVPTLVPQDLGLRGTEGFIGRTEEGFRRRFRFSRLQVANLAGRLLLPEGGDPLQPSIQIGHVRKFSAAFGLALALYRMTGHRFTTISSVFGIDDKDAVKIFTYVLTTVTDRFEGLLDLKNHKNRERIFDSRMGDFVEAISRTSGIPAESLRFFGFVDGTMSYHSRPSGSVLHRLTDQQWYREDGVRPVDATYCGHSKLHGLTYLVVGTPDGMLYMYDIKAGFHNDIGMQSEGSVQETRVRFNHATASYSVHFDRHFFARPAEGEQTVFIYGDQGFYKSERVMVPFPELAAAVAPAKRRFNKMMKAPRVSIEHLIGQPFGLFKLMKMKDSIKLFNLNQGRLIKFANILSNLRNIVRPNQISQWFQVQPPSLDEYLENY